jgi:hypothetical protein
VFGLEFDAEWIDVGSIGIAATWAIARACKRWVRARQDGQASAFRVFVCKTTSLDFSTGLGLFPFVVLAGAVFWSQLLGMLLSGSRVICAVAGIVGLVCVIEDF